MSEVLYDRNSKYKVLDLELSVSSEETSYGLNTVIEYCDEFYYIGDKPDNIETILDFCQQDLKIKLSHSQILDIIIDNSFLKDDSFEPN
jgi:hypothetical protein